MKRDPIECLTWLYLKNVPYWPDDDRLTVKTCCHNVTWVYRHYTILLLYNGMASVKKKKKSCNSFFLFILLSICFKMFSYFPLLQSQTLHNNTPQILTPKDWFFWNTDSIQKGTAQHPSRDTGRFPRVNWWSNSTDLASMNDTMSCCLVNVHVNVQFVCK